MTTAPLRTSPTDGLDEAVISLVRARAAGGTWHEVGASSNVDDVRRTTRAGDVLVLLGAIPRGEEFCVRARAWGTPTVWITDGHRPSAGVADHVLWSDGPAAPGWVRDTYDALRRAVDATGVVPLPRDEHPGEVCITCADEGIVVEVIRADTPTTASVRSPDGTGSVDTTLVGAVVPDDLLLVHAGTAISLIATSDPEEGAR